MALLYGGLYGLMMVGLIGIVGLLRAGAEQQDRRRMYQAALLVLLVNLVLFGPAVLIVLKHEGFYGVSDWLETRSAWACEVPNYLWKRKLNRAAGVLLSSASWLYQWGYLLPWVIWRRCRVRSESQRSQHQTWERGVWLGAALTTGFGLLFSLWVAWEGLSCGE
jgi:hypothetical protein